MDGNNFAKEAAEKGAACIFSERLDLNLPVPIIPVADARLSMSIAANYVFDCPSNRLRVLGVTGTNGKTTTTYLVEHILKTAGKRCGVIGTLGARWTTNDGELYSEAFGQTTPQAPEFQNMLYRMAENNADYVVMEVSSHALALNHVTGTQFAGACLTNVTQDHLDFHKSMENYWRAKRRLFEMLVLSSQKNKSAVANADDSLASEFLASITPDINKYTYSYNTKSGATLNLLSAEYSFDHSRLRLQGPEGEFSLNLKIGGPFNAYNAMAAFLICYGEGIDSAVIIQALQEFTGVPGRFEIVRSQPVGAGHSGREAHDMRRAGLPLNPKHKSSARSIRPLPENSEPLVIVDYAHTPDGLENVLNAARVLVPSGGKLIAVFGCGGDRDASKRPRMGEIAYKLADRVIVTSDNPRSEDPQKIIADILAGIGRLSSVEVEPDRAKAINAAIFNATTDDVIIIAGKGHETYQILGKTTIDFDDRRHARQALLERKGSHCV